MYALSLASTMLPAAASSAPAPRARAPSRCALGSRRALSGASLQLSAPRRTSARASRGASTRASAQLEPIDPAQFEQDWQLADRAAQKASLEFDKICMQANVSRFRARRTLDLEIKEPLGPDMKPKWPIENYMSKPDNFVKLVYPQENIKVVDRYNWEIRLAQIQLAQWFIVPIYRLEMRFSPQKGLLARSGTVTLDPENLPVRGLTLFITFDFLKGFDLKMRMYCLTTVSRQGDRVATGRDGSYRITKLQAMADLEVASFLPDVLKNIPGWQQVGDGILDAILVAIQVITQNQLEMDYLRKAKEAGAGPGR